MIELGQTNIGFVGAGKMGQAILQGLLAKGVSKEQLGAADSDAKTRSALKQSLGIFIAKDNAELARWADVLVLAVKPQQLDAALKGLTNQPSLPVMAISIAAGVSIERLEKALPGLAIVRVMPNLPATVGCGFSVLAAGEQVSPSHLTLAETIFTAVGKTAVLEEKHFDAITAVSGSGPAYVFTLIKAWQEAAVELGLPQDVARDAVAATLQGSLELLIQASDTPAELISKVASKGGTTEAALKVLDKEGFAEIFQRAVIAAAERSKELR